jgi:hypothetical protein
MGAKRNQQERLAHARKIAAGVSEIATFDIIEQMSRSSDTVTRIAAEIVLQHHSEELGGTQPFTATIQKLFEDPPSRWQALIAVAGCIQTMGRLGRDQCIRKFSRR